MAGKRADVPSKLLAAGPQAQDRRLVALAGARVVTIGDELGSNVARVRRLARPLPSPLRREELLHREDGSSRKHIKHRAPNLVGEDRQGFSFAVLLLDPRQDLLAVLRVA